MDGLLKESKYARLIKSIKLVDGVLGVKSLKILLNSSDDIEFINELKKEGVKGSYRIKQC